MSPRTGRPKVDNPQDVRFSIRLDQDINTRLDEYCEKNSLMKSEAIRIAIEDLLRKEAK